VKGLAMKNSIFILGALAIVSLISPPAEADVGTISAKVVDQSGNLVAGAKVWMFIIGGKSQAGVIPDCVTDETGTCTRADLEFGKYHLTAMKEDEGYPDLSLNLFGHDKKRLFTEISAQTPIASVVITLGTKAAAVILNVVDAITDKPIPNPHFKLTPAEHPEAFLGIGAHKDPKILIPQDEDIIIEVTADGYKPARVETQPEATHANAVHLHSEEEREFTVRLQRQQP